MGIEPYPTPEDRLRALAAGQTSVLEALAEMRVVRLAALVATDAAPVSYRAHLATAAELGLPPAKILGVFGAIAPLVGSARVLSAASKLVVAGLLPDEPRRITPSG